MQLTTNNGIQRLQQASYYDSKFIVSGLYRKNCGLINDDYANHRVANRLSSKSIQKHVYLQ